jgi:methionyl-tRNA formyltransferase
MSKQLKLSFAGTPEFAAGILQKLIEANEHEILGIYTQPDKPAGRGRKLHESAVKTLAESCQLTIKQPARPADIDPDGELSAIDILIVAAYGMLLPRSVLMRPRLGCINIHTSLLPRWRGAAPIQRAIQAGDKETGITIMQMDEGLDTGPVLLQKKCSIVNDETAETLHDKLTILGGEALLEILQAFAAGPVQGHAQNEKHACYAQKISKQEAGVVWDSPAEVIARTIRAFNPRPIAHTTLNNRQMKIWEACVTTTASNNTKPGTVLDCTKEGIFVATADRVLCIKKLQLPGKKIITAADFYNAHADFVSSE